MWIPSFVRIVLCSGQKDEKLAAAWRRRTHRSWRLLHTLLSFCEVIYIHWECHIGPHIDKMCHFFSILVWKLVSWARRSLYTVCFCVVLLRCMNITLINSYKQQLTGLPEGTAAFYLICNIIVPTEKTSIIPSASPVSNHFLIDVNVVLSVGNVHLIKHCFVLRYSLQLLCVCCFAQMKSLNSLIGFDIVLKDRPWTTFRMSKLCCWCQITLVAPTLGSTHSRSLKENIWELPD